MTTVAHEVARLLERGFRPLPFPNPSRRYGGTYLYRLTRDGHVDTVLIRMDTFTIAARLPDQFDPGRPLDVAHADWMHHGELGDVVGAFLRRFYADDIESTASRFVGTIDALASVLP